MAAAEAVGFSPTDFCLGSFALNEVDFVRPVIGLGRKRFRSQ